LIFVLTHKGVSTGVRPLGHLTVADDASAHVETFGPKLVHAYLVHDRKSVFPVQAGFWCQARIPFYAGAAAHARAISLLFHARGPPCSLR